MYCDSSLLYVPVDQRSAAQRSASVEEGGLILVIGTPLERSPRGHAMQLPQTNV